MIYFFGSFFTNALAPQSNCSYYLVIVLQFMLRIARCSQNLCTVFFRCTHDCFIFMLRAQQQKLNTHALTDQSHRMRKKQKKIDATRVCCVLSCTVLQFQQGLNIDRLGNILKLSKTEKPSECVR